MFQGDKNITSGCYSKAEQTRKCSVVVGRGPNRNKYEQLGTTTGCRIPLTLMNVRLVATVGQAVNVRGYVPR